MAIQEMKQLYENQNRRISEINRLLIFSGIAMVWLFNITSVGKGILLPESLHPVLILFLFAMIADLLQYLISFVCYRTFCLFEDKGHAPNTNMGISFITEMWLELIPQSLFGTKIAITIEAYIYLVLNLCGKQCCFCWDIIIWTAGVLLFILLLCKLIVTICKYVTDKGSFKDASGNCFIGIIVGLGVLIFISISIFVIVQVSIQPKFDFYFCPQNKQEPYCQVDTLQQCKCDTTLQKVLANQDAILTKLEKINKKPTSSTANKPRNHKKIGYLPVDTVNCDGVDVILVKQVKY